MNEPGPKIASTTHIGTKTNIPGVSGSREINKEKVASHTKIKKEKTNTFVSNRLIVK